MWKYSVTIVRLVPCVECKFIFDPCEIWHLQHLRNPSPQPSLVLWFSPTKMTIPVDPRSPSKSLIVPSRIDSPVWLLFCLIQLTLWCTSGNQFHDRIWRIGRCSRDPWFKFRSHSISPRSCCSHNGPHAVLFSHPVSFHYPWVRVISSLNFRDNNNIKH